MALGIQKVCVKKKPIVALISTGDEVIPPHQIPSPGQVRDINTYTLAALIQQAGGEPLPLGIVPDQPDRLQATLTQALQSADLVVITAGSSASTRDLTALVIKELGEPRLPSLRHKMRAKKTEIPVWGIADLGLEPTMVGLAGSFTQVVRVFSPPRRSDRILLQGTVEEQAEQLYRYLKEAKVPGV